MLKKLFIAIFTAGVLLAGCKKDAAINGDGSTEGNFERSSEAGVGRDTRNFAGRPSQTIPTLISAGQNVLLTADRIWILDGPTYVASGGILRIQPGTLVKGRSNSSRGSSYLLVASGGSLTSYGNPTNPVVFTSDKPAGQRAAGDWGGVILLGNAPTNNPGAQIEGILPSDIPSGVAITYGGSNAAHNGGTIRYTRIEYAGRDLGGGNEINGLTLGGVGNGTVLNNIQVTNGLDDAFEFFGGTVNAKFLVAFANTDDDFDFDNGYTGSIQFGVSLRNPNQPANLFSSDPNGIECDNDATGSSATPITRPVLSNFTILGFNRTTSGALLHGNRWRRNTSFALINSIIAGYDETGVFFDGAPVTNRLFTGGTGSFRNNAIQAVLDGVNPNPIPQWTRYVNNSPAAVGGSPATFVNLVAPFSIGTTNPNFPDFRYVTGSPAESNFNYSGLPSFFTALNYRGAFGAAGSPRWDDVWASYTPNANIY